MRRRYLALKMVTKGSVSRKDLLTAIWNAIIQLFGEYGASKTDLAMIKYKPREGYAILRCSQKAHEKVKASIASITEIEGAPAAIHIQKVSGTLKGLCKRAS